MQDLQCPMDSPLGILYLVASSRGLRGIYFQKQPVVMGSRSTKKNPAEKFLDVVMMQLTEYFQGKRKVFDVPLDVEGTSFQKKVWRQLCSIPFGSTVAYADVARGIGNPKAVRAVGSANGRNPVCIIVPCHRVIASDGTIGGYSGGLHVKRKLLALEGIKGF